MTDRAQPEARLEIEALAHELFTAAQLAPGEGIENAVGRLAALVEAQQPAPSAAADLIAALEEARSAINSMKVEAETAGQGDEQMMLEACETISNEGLQADMAIRAALASAPKPSSTPQADSQPAPVRDERDDFEKVFSLPSGCIRVGTGYASTGYSNWAAHTHCERWQGWQARAARAPADSVLEDAARYRFLASHCRSTSEHWGGRWSIIIDGPAPKSQDSEDDFDEAVDAARKQGANHDQ